MARRIILSRIGVEFRDRDGDGDQCRGQDEVRAGFGNEGRGDKVSGWESRLRSGFGVGVRSR